MKCNIKTVLLAIVICSTLHSYPTLSSIQVFQSVKMWPNFSKTGNKLGFFFILGLNWNHEAHKMTQEWSSPHPQEEFCSSRCCLGTPK